MKKIFSLTLTLLTLLCTLCTPVLAEAQPAVEVYVSISNAGQLVVTLESITVADIDGDGKFTLNDVLYQAHDKYHPDGADAFNSGESEFGISLNTLWGDSSGAFGYCINNASAMSLLDEVKAGDIIYAYIYTDQIGWSDKYSYFDKNSITAEKGDSVTLTLSASGYDENWNRITAPVEGAAITLNGEATGYKTDAEGKVTITLEKAGEFTVSAIKDGETLVPPICSVTVTNDNAFPLSFRHIVSICLIAAIAVIVIIKIRSCKKNASE